MSHRFDATLKDILSHSAADLTPILHLPADLPARALNIDLSTVSAATDVAFGFGDPFQQIVDINFQSGPDSHVDGRLLLYNAAYHHHYPVPVRSILILLRPAADLARLTGRLTYQAGGSRVEFDYEVVRLWQQPLDRFLTGGLALLPLAPLCQLAADLPLEQALRDVIHQIDQRLSAEVPYARAVQLMTATFVLTGLRVSEQNLPDLFRGVKVMHESSAFKLYEEKGRVEAYHQVLFRQGWNRFGPPDAATEAALRAIRDLDRLERMADAILTAHSWEEFLATP
jgi:hypothetical protein